MYHNLGDRAAEVVLQAIDKRLATKVEGASFVAGNEGEYHIDHFLIGSRIVRCEYHDLSARYYLDEITGRDLAEFRQFHRLH